MSNLTDSMTASITLDSVRQPLADNQPAIPDLSDILEQIDFDAKPSSMEDSLASHFHVGKWGALILELIANPADESLSQTYG